MSWTVEFLPGAANLVIELPADMRASLQRIIELIESHGLERVREPYLKHLEGRLWEMR